MAKATIILTGDELLNRRLKKLTGPEAKKVIRQASRTAMKRLLPRIKAAAPYKTGFLRKSLKVRAIKRSRVRVGVRIGTGLRDNGFGGKTFYGAFLEFGKTVKGVKKAGALHYVQATADRNKERIVRFYRWNIKKNLEALANQTK